VRIAILCNDTRGGVLPYAALARGLLDAGYVMGAALSAFDGRHAFASRPDRSRAMVVCVADWVMSLPKGTRT
jgi:aryl-alcohol dehydrogenase-like predicted oxidoreductase